MICSIVFSSWKNSLKMVGELLCLYSIRFDSIDGDLKLAQRKKVLEDFRSANGADILLMTLGTGAVGSVIDSPYEYDEPQCLTELC